jgi:hypothetical protein
MIGIKINHGRKKRKLRAPLSLTIIRQNFSADEAYGEGGQSESRGHVSIMMVARPKE